MGHSPSSHRAVEGGLPGLNKKFKDTLSSLLCAPFQLSICPRRLCVTFLVFCDALELGLFCIRNLPAVFRGNLPSVFRHPFVFLVSSASFRKPVPRRVLHHVCTDESDSNSRRRAAHTRPVGSLPHGEWAPAPVLDIFS